MAQGDLAYFAGSDAGTGMELWRTDGTPDGTARVLDLAPGTANGIQFPIQPVVFQGAVFFVGYEPGNAVLYRLDDHTPTRLATFAAGIQELSVVDATLYVADGSRLWKSDGTAAGTTVLADLGVGAFVGSLVALPPLLLFRGNDQHGGELWVSDGTAAGTAMVVDANPLMDDWTTVGVEEGDGARLTRGRSAVLDGVVYYQGNDGSHGWELWRSDGTAAGTSMVADLNPGEPDGAPTALAALGRGRIFFQADGGTAGREVWSSDGTEAGTMQIADLNPGPAGSSPDRFVATGGAYYFVADVPPVGRELWRLTPSP